MRRKRRKGRFLFLLAVIIAAMFYDSNYRLVTEAFTIENAKIPQSLSGLRIVHLSDLHAAEYGEDNGEFFDAIEAAQPDLIAITGDIIDGSSDETEMARERAYVADTVTRLAAMAPVYYVTGNHEWVSPWKTELFRLIADCGATVLHNEYVLLASGGESIVLAGVDDPNGPYDMKTPAELVAEIRENEGDKYIVMLAHRHDRMDMWAELGVDLVLCGHAHGGMVRLPFTDGLYGPGRVFLPTYTSGVYTEKNTTELVSRGVGGMKMRFLNNPEIIVAVLTGG